MNALKQNCEISKKVELTMLNERENKRKIYLSGYELIRLAAPGYNRFRYSNYNALMNHRLLKKNLTALKFSDT